MEFQGAFSQKHSCARAKNAESGDVVRFMGDKDLELETSKNTQLTGPSLRKVVTGEVMSKATASKTKRRRNPTRKLAFDVRALLDSAGVTKNVKEFHKTETIFSQGDAAKSVMYVQEGGVKLSVVNEGGKEAVVAILGPGDFFGEGCLAGQSVRMGRATAVAPSTVLVIDKKAMTLALHREHTFSDLFVAYLLVRNIRYEEDLVNQLFNSSEKRLARLLLLLAHFGKDGVPETVIPKISQETLAEMVGTTRSRVSSFMNKFRRLGFIKYNGGLQVNTSLLSVVLHD